jgi:uncharacterized protein YbjT (DUF2867 family)
MTEQSLTVLVTGATGFIGRRLVDALDAAGHRVRALTRDPGEYDGPGEPVLGDVLDTASLAEPMAGVDVAVYLVHAQDESEFRRRGVEAAQGFGSAAAASGVRQIVYLGALGEEAAELPPQLRSRREVEGLLGASGVPVTVLRAGIVVGAGGVSWEMTRQLVKNLPAMVVPRWADTRTQPIAVDDVVRYLAGVAGVEKTFGQVYEIGGADQLTYVHMLQSAAEAIHGRRVPIVTLPVMTQRLSSLWIGLVTDLDSTTASSLIDSMSTEVIQTDDAIQDIVPGKPLSYREAVERAVAEETRPR